tara:strand:- start:94 stop:756 length:663 start_codon:yes stop_codon:yes gene_type:complete
MKVIVFDTETTGLPKNRKSNPQNTELFPYVCQLSWLVYDDNVGKIVKVVNKIIKLPDGVIIPEVCVNIHGITNEMMREKGENMKDVLMEFTKDWMDSQILIAHNLDFDNKVLQAEYYRNNLINWLGRHRKIEYCTMKYGKKFTSIWRPSKFSNNMYQKPPKLVELHVELFKEEPKNLHNALIDVYVCFRCFHQMVYSKDIFTKNNNENITTNNFRTLCGM